MREKIKDDGGTIYLIYFNKKGAYLFAFHDFSFQNFLVNKRVSVCTQITRAGGNNLRKSCDQRFYSNVDKKILSVQEETMTLLPAVT